MDFRPQRSLYRFRPLQLALQFFNFSIFGLELGVELPKQDFQFSNVAALREKISLESTVAASAHRPHGVDDFALAERQWTMLLSRQLEGNEAASTGSLAL